MLITTILNSVRIHSVKYFWAYSLCWESLVLSSLGNIWEIQRSLCHSRRTFDLLQGWCKIQHQSVCQWVSTVSIVGGSRCGRNIKPGLLEKIGLGFLIHQLQQVTLTYSLSILIRGTAYRSGWMVCFYWQAQKHWGEAIDALTHPRGSWYPTRGCSWFLPLKGSVS